MAKKLNKEQKKFFYYARKKYPEYETATFTRDDILNLHIKSRFVLFNHLFTSHWRSQHDYRYSVGFSYFNYGRIDNVSLPLFSPDEVKEFMFPFLFGDDRDKATKIIKNYKCFFMGVKDEIKRAKKNIITLKNRIDYFETLEKKKVEK